MDNVFVLYDRATQSVWYPGENALEAVSGSLKGSSIEFLDELPMTPSGKVQKHRLRDLVTQ